MIQIFKIFHDIDIMEIDKKCSDSVSNIIEKFQDTPIGQLNL